MKVRIIMITEEYIKEYIDIHINEEHDYSYADDERDYDLCLYCDCRRYKDSNKWVVEE
jgi:hypothetical protein